MPSLWDFLCVTRPHKYSTHHNHNNNDYTYTSSTSSSKSKSKRQPRPGWDEPPYYYDPSSVEYYIQPALPSSSRRSADPMPSAGSSVQHTYMLPPRSPNSRRNLRVRDSPRASRRPSQDWYVEVRAPPPHPHHVFQSASTPSSPSRDFSREGGGSSHPLMMMGPRSHQQVPAAAVPPLPHPAAASYPPPPPQQPVGLVSSSGQQQNVNFLDRNCDAPGSSGKRRHVKDIFADVSPCPQQYHGDSGLRTMNTGNNSTAASVVSAGSYHHHTSHSDRVGRSGGPDASGFAVAASGARTTATQQGSRPEPRQNPRSMPISGSGQPSSGFRGSSGSSGAQQPSPYLQPSQPNPRQAQARYIHPAVQHGQPSWTPSASSSSSFYSSRPGGGPSSRTAKAPESMHQYSPRTVSDSAISAALMGNRIDDFVHDPGWNRAIDRFATSPTTSPASPTAASTTTTTPSVFSFEDKSFPRAAASKNKRPASSSQHKTTTTVSPTTPDGNVIFVVNTAGAGSAQSSSFQTKSSVQADSRSSSSRSQSPEPGESSSPRNEDVQERSAVSARGEEDGDPGHADRDGDDVFSSIVEVDGVRDQGRESGNTGDLNPGPGGRPEQQDPHIYFCADDEVLY